MRQRRRKHEMWLPMLLLAVMASGSACPDFCQCRSPVIECRGHAPKLTYLDKLPTTYTDFKIHQVAEQEELRMYVARMPNSTFFRNLQKIEVTNCTTLINLHYLKWDVARDEGKDFAVLPNVRMLNISYNKLVDLPGQRVNDKLMNNNIQIDNNISTDSKHASSKLVWLSLASNNLDYISPNNFRYLQSLEYLDVSNNVLHTLEGMFDSLKSLQRLNVASNKLEHVQTSWFQNLAKLVELDISRNKLTFIPADTLQPLASLSVLKLAENPLIERDLSLLLGTGRRLETVDASRIGLIRVPAALTRSVRTLKLAGNQLTSINSGDLDSYPLLRLLDLSNNRLMIIEEDALGRLDGLEELILSGNILPTIPKSLPSGLKVFDLRQNAISKLKANDLQGLYLLKELNLSGNVISVIEGGSFRQLPALETLDISDNPIKNLPSDTLSGPSNLITLRMSGLMSLETEEDQNQDTAFPILTPERLVKLDVSRSPALAAQLLADNAALSACKSLQELDLSYTNISAMRSDLAYVLPQLRKLNLIGNEWNCSADQFWIGEWMRQHKSSLKFSTRCATPNKFEGKLLEELPAIPNNQMITPNGVTVQIHTTKMPELKTIINKMTNTPKPTNSQALESSTASESTTKTTFKAKYSTTEILPTTTAVFFTLIPSQTKTIPISTSTKYLQKNEKLKPWATTSPPMIHETVKPVPITTIMQDLIDPSTTSDFEEYTTKTINYETDKFSTQSITPMSWMKSNKVPRSTTSNIESKLLKTISSDRRDRMTKEIFTTTPMPRDTQTATTTIITTLAPSTVSTTTSVKADATTEPSPTIPKSSQPALIKIEEDIMNKYGGVKEMAATAYDDRSTNHIVSEFSRSKLLLANEEPHVNDEPNNSFAEELNSQATESGARTSESLTSGAHPGMLVLLGAAIGAAAALTVVLSRHATVKRRDRQYQRHENIEVHALTPTTELW